MVKTVNKATKLVVIIWVFVFLHGCAGPDYMPQYFPSAETEDGKTPKIDESDNKEIPSGSCTISLSSTLCVILQGDNISVGTDEKEPLCTEVGPIPIEVNGASLLLRGSTFPDIPFEGHGLPAPITINAKGTGDGSSNLGKGKVDADGNITIEGFSFFINALGMIGEIPDLFLTTGKIEDLDGIKPTSGEPLGADSHVKIITGAILGHLFPAADEKLLGASLLASFDGTINPPLSECKGTEAKPLATYVVKLVVDDKGEQTEAILPGANRMEVGEGYIAQGPENIGPQFEADAKFKVVNATTSPLEIDIPPIVGPFIIEAAQGSLLKQTLPPKTPLIIKVTFRPTSENLKKAGEVNEMLVIGPDIYQLIGSAVSPSGKPTLTIVDELGEGVIADDLLNVGNVMVSTTGRREFFMCKKIICNGLEQPTQCVSCVDVLNNVCQLLPVDKIGKPLGEVDNACKDLNPSAKGDLAIGLFGENALSQKQVLEIKNDGIKPLTINSIEIQDLDGAKSKNQFKVSVDSELPVTLEPYGTSKAVIRITVVYEPNDILGLDGIEANVGRPVKDRAILHIVTNGGSQSIELSGATTIKEIPDMQVFFKSATGTKELKDGSQFSFRGLTATTSDLAVPVFIKLSDSAASPLRVTSVATGSGSPFEWLDTKEKIEAKPKDVRCVIPVFDENGGQVSTISDLNPVSLLPNGFDLKPGAYTADTMPLLGCVNFHMGSDEKRQYTGALTIKAAEITSDGQPVRNSDGSIKQSDIKINLLAVINPLKGRLVFRVTQTMAAIMNPQFPSNSAVASKEEMDIQIAEGKAKDEDRFVMPGALILDPFDEETIKDEIGNILTIPSDGKTGVYRKIDTHAMPAAYEDPLLPDYTSLLFDSEAKEGEKGMFFDYPNLPDELKIAGLRVFTAGLSYPGPLVSPEKRFENVSQCEQIDPCSEEGQRRLGEGPKDKSKKGVCAFFYASGARWDSPSMRKSSEMEGGELKDYCKSKGEPQKLNDITGTYDLSGEMTYENVGLRLWGPTYFHNPAGPLGSVPPLDEILHLTFTTGVLQPSEDENAPDLLPEKRINVSKLEHKINLTDTTLETPRLCDNSVKNRLIRGEYYSTWKYLAPLLVKDEEGKIPTGCPEADNSFTGGSAFVRGRPLDQETGIVTLVGGAKFSSSDNLTFAFKDVMFFIVFNGWVCDPTGSEADFEGALCFDKAYNDRDGASGISIMK